VISKTRFLTRAWREKPERAEKKAANKCSFVDD
jgi:hypothetical protein